jgi:MoaA/NifB/PqqE/SkfB family radical SAM enzyme
VRSADISIDAATPATYAENRRGGEFDILLERLEFIARLRREGPLEWFGINMTVQANNFREMTAFAALGRRFGADVVSFAQITNWGTFSAEEFAARAVHKPEHPEHAEFRRVLDDPALHAPGIYLSNLSDLSDLPAAEVALPW